jgi:DNA invertase Pin-like site-specific DNA recombinase
MNEAPAFGGQITTSTPEADNNKCPDDPLIDTTSPHGKLIIAVLAALAEFERSMILNRCQEGRVRAMANGVPFGRKPKLTKHQIAEAVSKRERGETLMEIARSYNVSHSTISRL